MSADNAIAVLRTRNVDGVGHEYRLAEYGVSGEPFRHSRRPESGDGGNGWRRDGEDWEFSYDDFEPALEVNGVSPVEFDDAEVFVTMFEGSQVFPTRESARVEARRIEEEDYVEYGTFVIAVEFSWEELLAQRQAVRNRRLTCKVLGPESVGDWDALPVDNNPFRSMGRPGIEEELLSWGWSAKVVSAVSDKVGETFFDFRRYPNASHLRLARKGEAQEEERYRLTCEEGCCQAHDETFEVTPKRGSSVTVLIGFNHSH